MVYILIITIMNGVVFPPDKKIAGVYQDEATCEKYRNAMAFAVTDTRFKSSIKFSCDPWKIEKD